MKMIRTRMRFPGFCVSRLGNRARVRFPPKQYNYKQSSYTNDAFGVEDKTDFSNNSIEMNFIDDTSKPESDQSGNRVMVVVDSSSEAKGALQWALSHTIQSQDTVILLHVTKPPKQGANSSRKRAYELLCSMKSTCQLRRPGVQVEVVLVEGKEKGAIIVEEAKQHRVSLLVLGQRKRSIMWRLQTMWSSGKRTRSRVVEYCIQNANCMTIAVRKKNRNYGGYLITTKRHKDFWQLA